MGRLASVIPTGSGVLMRAGSFWVGTHWSGRNKRLCVNIVPCVTVWFTWPGGARP